MSTMKTGTTPFSLTSTHTFFIWIPLRDYCHRTCHLDGGHDEWAVPNWVVEGQATMQETWQSNTGRRGAIPDMIKRTMTIEGHFPP